MTVAEAVELVNEAIAALAVGPEQVIAVDPDEVTVDWDTWLCSARFSKASVVRNAVRGEVHGYLHQMPQVLLVAGDGAVMGLFGLESGTKVA